MAIAVPDLWNCTAKKTNRYEGAGVIPYLYLGRKTCTHCGKPFEFDTRLTRRVRTCAPCKKEVAKAAYQRVNARVKQQRTEVIPLELERLAVRTYEQVGAMMVPPMTAEAVRRVELGAFAKLRKRFAHIGKELFE